MVRGIELFKEYFANYTDKYILIGGAACTVLMEEAGLPFRATKDLDIVLCVEALDAEFVNAFWAFIKDGRYQNRQKSTGEKIFYRFSSPADKTYPEMLELFSRAPDALALTENSHLTPIPVDEEASSLSAILLDDAYYQFINEGTRKVNGLRLLVAEHMIPLKAKAWLDMKALTEKGIAIQSVDVKKHHNDIFRLYQLLSPDRRIELPEPVRKDLQQCVDIIAGETINLLTFGLGNTTLSEVVLNLKKIYGLNP